MLGAHCATNSSVPLNVTIQDCIDSGWTCCQIFFGSPQDQFKRRTLSDSELKQCVKLCKSFKLYTHYPYTMNLVKKCTIGKLNGLQHEITTLSQMGGRVVIHPNSPAVKNGPTNANPEHPVYKQQYSSAIDTMFENIKLLVIPKGSHLLLEPPAGEGQKIGWSFEQIEYICDSIKKNNMQNTVGLCIDTCHSYAAGLSTFRSPESVDKFFNNLEIIEALEHVKVVHLNDSMEGFKSRKDRHDILGSGKIWSNNMQSLRHFVLTCITKGIDVVCETGGHIDVCTCMKLLYD